MSIIQRGAVLVASDATGGTAYGISAGLSADGAILVVGDMLWSGTASNQGGVYVYDRSGATWTQRGGVLVAAPAAASDYFGASVAISSNGLVLAVGAPGYGDGGVYVYDWSGGAWVYRGSPLIAADAATGDGFGSSIGLSADGAILTVGAPGRGSAQGGVYVYDWTGGAWVQRGSVLVASDAALSDRYGEAVALAANGLVMVVCAYAWDGTKLDQGGVYVYDWTGGAWVQRGSVMVSPSPEDYGGFGIGLALNESGSALFAGVENRAGEAAWNGSVYAFDWTDGAWVQRGSVLVASDAAGEDYFDKVAVSADGLVLAVGASGWDGGLADQGGVYVYDVFDGVGAPTAPTELTVGLASGAPVCSTALTVSWPTGTPTAPTALSVSATGTPTAPTALAVIPLAHVPNWTVRCLIGGVDVSARLVGQVRVTAEEGAARIASVTLQPPSGTIAPLDYVGKTITIDYVLVIGATTVPRRIFSGRVDTPAYDPASTLLTLTCTDDLQNRVAALHRSVIDALVGGRFSTAVQGEMDDNWDYAQARLETVAASLDADASGGLRLTPWESAVVWATLGDGDLKYEHSVLTLPQRSTLVNHVDIEYAYRYPRLRQRYGNVAWSGTLIDMAPCGYQYPTQADIAGAVSGTGWTPIWSIYFPAPTSIAHSSGGVIVPPDDAISMAIIYLAQRHSQTVTEQYTLRVTADESVAANGELAHALRGALASEFDGGAWESALDVLPLMPIGGDMDYSPDATRQDSDYAIQTLLDQARVKILGSHRGARVGNAVLCNPALDLDKRVAISTSGMSVEGKVASLTHILDLASGSATTEFELACFGVGGAGIITPDTLAPPTPPAEAAETQEWIYDFPSLQVNTFGVTPYSDGLMGLLINPPASITVQDVPTADGPQTQSFPNPDYVAGSYPVTGFRVRMPGVDDGDRNPLDKTVSRSYSILIPEDTLTFTVP